MMLQAVSTIFFLALAATAAAAMSVMVRANWVGIRAALGLPEARRRTAARYRILPASAIRVIATQDVERCQPVA